METASKKIAVFMDYDNQKVDPSALLTSLQERGKVVMRRAYADWVRSSGYRLVVTKAGFEMIDCPKMGGDHKNAADVRMTLDCLETCYEHSEIEVFVIVTGDVDFVPLVNKLRMKGRETIVVVENQDSASQVLQYACDEFIPSSRFDNLERVETTGAILTRESALLLYRRAFDALAREGQDPNNLNPGLVKQRMVQLNSAFDQQDLHFKIFTDFREWAMKQTHVAVGAAQKSGEKQTAAGGGLLPIRDLTRIYNAALKQHGAPVTIHQLEENAHQFVKDFTPQKYGYELLEKLVTAAAQSLHIWKVNGDKIQMPPDQRIKQTLRMLELDQSPDKRQRVIESLITVVKAWSDDPSLLTVKEARKHLRVALNPFVSGADIDSVLRCARNGGGLLDADGSVQTSYGFPFKLSDDIEDRVLMGYLLSLVGPGNLEANELPAVAACLNNSDVERIERLLNSLTEQGKLIKQDGRWIRPLIPLAPTAAIAEAI
jgi:uncharacterized protein (TIGR00288 family)